MCQWQREPELDELLAEPIVAALMRRDGASPGELRSLLRAVARTRRPQDAGSGASQDAPCERKARPR